MSSAVVSTPVGDIVLVANEGGLSHLQYKGSRKLPERDDAKGAAAGRHLDAARRALDAYFAGDSSSFEALSLAPVGTPFQQRIWKALRRIPYGQTRSYGEVARSVRRAGAARAVGLANNRNPIAIIIPCHRVIGVDGSLTGYGGGISRKRWLLRHEGGWSDAASKRG